jgi:hypothetical protein
VNRLDRPVRPAGTGFGRTVPVRSPVEHGCSSTARAAVFDRSKPAVRTVPVCLGGSTSHVKDDFYIHVFHASVLFTVQPVYRPLLTPAQQQQAWAPALRWTPDLDQKSSRIDAQSTAAFRANEWYSIHVLKSPAIPSLE